VNGMVSRPLHGLSLCAGGGGLDLGVMLAEPGYHTRAFVEREEWPRVVLIAAQRAGYFAPAPVWDDLRSFDARPFLGAFDIVLAGYPCQPFSAAGKRAGANDPRHLWPDVARVIADCRPEWVFLENVSGHVTLGLETVLRELWGMGYTPAAGLFSAAEVGATHQRLRIFKRTGKVLNDDRADWREAWALFPGDVAYVWHGALHASTVAESLAAAGFAIRSQIIWAKDRLVLSRGDYHWQHEPCWYAVKKTGKGHWAGDRKQTTLWQISGKDQDAATVHGTQKPVECMRRPILNNSNPGQAVFEPFMGSGTTLIAAETTGRVCFGIELNPAYIDVAIERWQQFTGANAVLADTGETFADLKAKRLAA